MKRFGRYVAADGKSCLSNYGLDMLTAGLAGLAFYLILAILHMFGIMRSWTFNNTDSGILFGISLFAIVITMGAKCYGHLTDKKAGSMFTLLPASVLEKTLSIIIWSLLIPLFSMGLYLGIDWILSLIDNNYGLCLIQAGTGLRDDFSLLTEEMAEEGIDINFITNPMIYVDDLLSIMLIFVLGAICFKKSKTAKTILTVIGASMVLGLAFGSGIARWFENMEMRNVEYFSNLMNHLQMWDTLFDLVVLIGICVAIFFRLKTIKH